MKIIKNLLAVVGLISISGLFIFAVQTPVDKDIKVEQKMDNGYNIHALKIPEDLNFADEPLPLSIPDVYERMDRELLVNTYWQSNALLMFKRAQKYFPV